MYVQIAYAGIGSPFLVLLIPCLVCESFLWRVLWKSRTVYIIIKPFNKTQLITVYIIIWLFNNAQLVNHFLLEFLAGDSLVLQSVLSVWWPYMYVHSTWQLHCASMHACVDRYIPVRCLVSISFNVGIGLANCWSVAKRIETIIIQQANLPSLGSVCFPGAVCSGVVGSLLHNQQNHFQA